MLEDFTAEDIINSGAPSLRQLAADAHERVQRAKQLEVEAALAALADEVRTYLRVDWALPEPIVAGLQFKAEAHYAVFTVEGLTFRAHIDRQVNLGETTEEMIIEYQKSSNLWNPVGTLADLGRILA